MRIFQRRPISPRLKKLTRALAILLVAVSALWFFFPTLFAWVVSAAKFHKFLEGPSARGASLWKGARYCGISGEYAIFCSRMDFQLPIYFKVPRNEVRGFPDFPFTIWESKWVHASYCTFEDGKIVAEDPAAPKSPAIKNPAAPTKNE
jgi:hypothetical protein